MKKNSVAFKEVLVNFVSMKDVYLLQMIKLLLSLKFTIKP